MRGLLQTIAGVLCCVGLLTGCERSTPESPAPPAQSTTPTDEERASVRDLVSGRSQPAASEMTGLPPGHPPIDNIDLTAQAPPSTAGRLTYTIPESWTETPVSSSVREAQYALPKSEGDAVDGELIVFYFGTGGAGGVDANIERWVGQFRTAEGGPIPEGGYSRRAFEVNELTVAFVEVEGTYNDGMAVGRDSADQENFRLLGAIVATPVGPWYFKGVGPSRTMQEQRENFLAFVQTMKFETP
ncbi:MAG: hypothetical protein IPM18_16830 [Phycisphaerales bacterium]|nr:hypothetical protein [Phycisphaerales bacterium]